MTAAFTYLLSTGQILQVIRSLCKNSYALVIKLCYVYSTAFEISN